MSVHVHIYNDAGWDESKHPRDHGQFAKAGGGAETQVKLFKPSEMKRGKEALANLPHGDFKGEAQTEHIFSNKVAGDWNYGVNDLELPDGGEVKLIALSHVVPTQGSVDTAQVAKFLGNTTYANQGMPTAVYDSKTGKYYLQDGHHRLSADILAGRKAAPVHVIEVNGKPKR